MLSYRLSHGVKLHIRSVICRRNLGLAAPMLQKASDPIQQLFVEKIREYRQKSGPDAKLVDPSAETQREIRQEMEKVANQYGVGKGADATKFPTFQFQDPTIDPINLEQQN